MDRPDPVDSMDKRHFSRVPFDAHVSTAFNKFISEKDWISISSDCTEWTKV